MNFQIQHLKNLTPRIVGVESNRMNFKLIFFEFFEYFLPFRINRIANFQVKSNEFQTNANLTPPLACSKDLKVCQFFQIL